MDPLAADLAARGIASWNIEYRRPDRHAWAATTADVDAAIRYLSQLAERFPLDLTRVILVGHSAGAQLAARVAADLLTDAATDALKASAAPADPLHPHRPRQPPLVRHLPADAGRPSEIGSRGTIATPATSLGQTRTRFHYCGYLLPL